MFPWWEQAFDSGAVASSPVRTESQAGLGDLASLHVTVRVQRPHVSGRMRTNTNSAFYPFRGGVTHVVHRRGSQIEAVWPGCVYAWVCTSTTVEGLARSSHSRVAGWIGESAHPCHRVSTKDRRPGYPWPGGSAAVDRSSPCRLGRAGKRKWLKGSLRLLSRQGPAGAEEWQRASQECFGCGEMGSNLIIRIEGEHVQPG